MTTEFLFAYGTILHEPADPHVAIAIDRYAENVDAGYVRGKLYDIGGFPGAVPLKKDEAGQALWVWGTILRLLSPKRVLPILDDYEEVDFNMPHSGVHRRERIEVFQKSNPEEPIECIVYWINKVPSSAKLIKSGSWAKHLESQAPKRGRRRV